MTSVQFSHSVVSDSLQPHESQHARPPCPSPTPRVYSNSCPLSRWCHPAISSSVVPFSSCPQSLPASGSFPMSQLFAVTSLNAKYPTMWRKSPDQHKTEHSPKLVVSPIGPTHLQPQVNKKRNFSKDMLLLRTIHRNELISQDKNKGWDPSERNSRKYPIWL